MLVPPPRAASGPRKPAYEGKWNFQQQEKRVLPAFFGPFLAPRRGCLLLGHVRRGWKGRGGGPCLLAKI